MDASNGKLTDTAIPGSATHRACLALCTLLAALLVAPLCWSQQSASVDSAPDAVAAAVARIDVDRIAALTALRTMSEDANQPLRGEAAVALANAMVDGPERTELPTYAQALNLPGHNPLFAEHH